MTLVVQNLSHTASRASLKGDGRVAIVGGGFCGTLVAVHLLRARRFPRLQITLIEQTGRMGWGVAYGTRDPAHVLNVPAGRMSAFAQDPDHFLRFATRYDGSVNASTFARRSLYGDYVADCLASAEATSLHRLIRVTGEVTSVSRTSHGHIVALASGEEFFADAVVLAVGSPRTAHPWAELVRAPWDDGALDKVPRGANVVLLGTGLTMVDVALSVARDPSVKVLAVSRHGLLRRPRQSIENGFHYLDQLSQTARPDAREK
jgi:uncharacterized NAD(P)/FAD-binding protein YdhS